MNFKSKRSNSSKTNRKAKNETDGTYSANAKKRRGTEDLDRGEEMNNEENVTGRFVCDQCKKVLFSTKAINFHKAKYHKRHKKARDGSVIKHCEFCKQKIFLPPTTENKLIDKLVCMKCKISLYQPSGESLSEPNKINDDVKNSLECVDCGRWFDSWRGITMHMQKHAHENEDVVTKYVCTECDFRCPILLDFVEHFKAHNTKLLKGEDLKCEDCSLMFSSAAKYIKHVKIHSENQTEGDASGKEIMLKCCQPYCNAIFLKKDSFKNHQYMHQYLCYECRVCNKFFRTARSYNRHYKTHAPVVEK